MRVSKKFLAVLALVPLIAGASACSKADKESNVPLVKPKACIKTITPASSGEVPEVRPAENASIPEAMAGKDFGQEPTIAPGSGAPPSDLIRSILIKGSGSEVSANTDVVVNYVGQTWDRKVFDNSWKRDKTATFNLREVVQSWRWGLAGAYVGDRVELVIPPKLGYGELTPEEQAQKAAGKGITGKPKLAGDTLVFVADIVFSPPVLNEPQLAAYTQVPSRSKSTDAKLPDGLKIYCQPGEKSQPAYVEGAKTPSQPVTVWTVEGQGCTIEAGDQVGYVLVYGSWGDTPQSTWTNGSSVTWVKAEDAKVVSKKVDSRVVSVGPPNGTAKRGVVQIVDIVDATSLSEEGNTPAKQPRVGFLLLRQARLE